MTPKERALAFLKEVTAGNIRAAFAAHIGPGFISHNPYFGSSAAALQSAMEENHRTHPLKRFDVQRAVAEGDLVAVHSRLRIEEGGRDHAAVHLFRFEKGLIVEFWDVVQAAPESSPNAAGLF